MKTISKGYIPAQDAGYYLLRRHPFRILKPGEKIDTPYRMHERKQLVSAVGYYNRRYKLGLVVSYLDATKEIPYRHMIVGRPKPGNAPLNPLME